VRRRRRRRRRGNSSPCCVKRDKLSSCDETREIDNCTLAGERMVGGVQKESGQTLQVQDPYGQ
jgi:hypothetical protein